MKNTKHNNIKQLFGPSDRCRTSKQLRKPIETQNPTLFAEIEVWISICLTFLVGVSWGSISTPKQRNPSRVEFLSKCQGRVGKKLEDTPKS